MGMNSTEFNFNLSSVYVPQTISDFLTEVSVIPDISEKSSKLHGYVQILEAELAKIHAFKRELPLCMLLLNDAIRRLKEETMQCVRTEVRPVTEEFIPLKGNSDKNGGGKTSSDFNDKKNWMSSVQLWSTTNRDTVEDGSATKNQFKPFNFKKRGGVFLPFKAPTCVAMKEDKLDLPVQGVSRLKPVDEMGSIDLNLEGNSTGSRSGSGSGSGSSSVTDQMKPQTKPNQQQHQQQQKKQRRCWSPELHRRFVDTLQQLGGAQTSTPKHIRELMQVDGLTNDEVKSHLQKYRIHVRKFPSSSAATSMSTGLWMFNDQCRDVSKENHYETESLLGSLHLHGSARAVSTSHGDGMEEEDEK